MSEQQQDQDSIVLYVNQGRFVRGDEQKPWENACQGHHDIYGAIHCQEKATEAMQGRRQDHLGQRIHQDIEQSFKEGWTPEMRIVKRTATVTVKDEVVDEPVLIARAA